MATNREVDDLLHATAFDANGDKLGSISEVFINDSSGQPDFVEINHGLFGMGPSLVPLRGHTLDGDDLRLAFPKDRIKDAPQHRRGREHHPRDADRDLPPLRSGNGRQPHHLPLRPPR